MSMIPRHHLRRTAALLALVASLAPASLLAQDKDKDGKKDVITPENVNPNETFNLPPNFKPDYRPRRTPRRTKVTIDFRQAKLDEVVKFFSDVMNMNFIIADNLQNNKTITIINPNPISVYQAFAIFQEALNQNGLTIVQIPGTNFYKITDSKSSIKEGSMRIIDPKGRTPNESSMATKMIAIEHVAPEEIQQVLQQFASPQATIIVYGSNLIITDNGRNLRRMEGLVRQLDRADATTNRVFIYKVMHAEASEIGDQLKKIFQGDQGGNANTANARRNNRRAPARAANNVTKVDAKTQQPEALDVEITELIADERTNQLIIVSNERSFERIKQMIELLDVPTAVGGQIHVKFLEYANAEDLAGTLSGLASGARTSGRTTSRTSRTSNARTPATRGGSTGQVAQILSGDVQITAHKPTNSLIIIASPRDYLALDKVVSLLDRPRRQVYVEAVIMEIGLDVNRKIGLGANAVSGQDFKGIIPQSAIDSGLISDTNGAWLGQSNFGDGPTSLFSGAGGLGLIGPSLSLSLGGTTIPLPAFALFLQATQTDNSVNILSTPSILTLDNEEAEIVVGDRVPFLRGLGGGSGLSGLAGLAGLAGLGGGTSSTAGLSGLSGLAGGLISPIDYEDVGITLRITPQVNQSNYVRLEVNQEVSDIKGAGGLGAGAPIRTKRNIKNVVLVKDQSTVVIGGLMRDVENETIEKVPFLGDVPLVGILFRKNSTIKNKQNLVLMLTPYIIESELDLKKIYERKKREREELLKLFQKRDINYMKSVNYDKKGGLVDRMRQTIGKARDEETARKEALKSFEETGPRWRVLKGVDEKPEVKDAPKPEVKDAAPQTTTPDDPKASSKIDTKK